MFIRIILFVFLGYILVKTFKFLKSLYTIMNSKKEEDKIYDTSAQKSKIDKKDVIDAQFEEIEVKDDSSSNK
jgi:hypothetical protein